MNQINYGHHIPQQQCRHFFGAGGCKWHSNCYYSHVPNPNSVFFFINKTLQDIFNMVTITNNQMGVLTHYITQQQKINQSHPTSMNNQLIVEQKIIIIIIQK